MKDKIDVIMATWAWRYLPIIVFILINAVDGDITKQPSSTLIPIGDTSKLYCSVDSAYSDIDWAVIIRGQNTTDERYDLIAVDCVVQPNYTALFDVESAPAQGSCNLVFVDASSEHGGQYVCFDDVINADNSSAAFVSVLATNVTGSQTVVAGDVVVGDVVNYTCTILFHGNVVPSLSWSVSGEGGYSNVVINETISWETSTLSVEVGLRLPLPECPAILSPTCEVSAWDAAWNTVYFWRAQPINVPCISSSSRVIRPTSFQSTMKFLTLVAAVKAFLQQL